LPSKVTQNQSHQAGKVELSCVGSRGMSDEEHFTAPTLTASKFAADIAGAGTAAIINGLGGLCRCRDNGAAGDNHGGITKGGIQSLQLAGYAEMTARANFTQLNNSEGWLVMHNNGAFNAVGDWLGFVYRNTVNANWRCMSTIGGGAINDQDSGVPVVNGINYRLKIKTTPANGALFYINDALVATKAVGLITGAPLELRAYVDDTASADAANHDLILDFFNGYMVEGY
jgi:hypothetical protein